jgi:SAM-dependent methyltransferase
MARAVLRSVQVQTSGAVRHGELQGYYESIAPFYEGEMAVRADIPDWVRLVELAAARSVIDLGCGNGRIARALAPGRSVVGVDLLTALLPRDPGFRFAQADIRRLPFADGRFDLAIAANDPFAHLLADDDRIRGLDEAARAARRVVIDGLALTAADAAQARAGGHVRQAALPDGTVRHETWEALGGGRYRTTYRYLRAGATIAEASADVRAWTRGDPALRRREHDVAGGLDGRPYDPGRGGFVITIGGRPWA